MKHILIATAASLILSIPAFANTSSTAPTGETTYEVERMEETVTPQADTSHKKIESKKTDSHSLKNKKEMQKQEEMQRDMNKTDSDVDSSI